MSKEIFTGVKFVDRLNFLIAESGKSQKQIAAESGVSEAALSNYKNGRVPNVDESYKLAKYFGILVDDLLCLSPPGNYRALFKLVSVLADASSGGEEEKQALFNRATEAMVNLDLALSKSEEQIQLARRNLGLLLHEFMPSRMHEKARNKPNSGELSERARQAGVAGERALELEHQSRLRSRAVDEPTGHKSGPSPAVSPGSKGKQSPPEPAPKPHKA